VYRGGSSSSILLATKPPGAGVGGAASLSTPSRRRAILSFLSTGGDGWAERSKVRAAVYSQDRREQRAPEVTCSFPGAWRRLPQSVSSALKLNVRTKQNVMLRKNNNNNNNNNEMSSESHPWEGQPGVWHLSLKRSSPTRSENWSHNLLLHPDDVRLMCLY